MNEYEKIIICDVDYVTSKQFQEIRREFSLTESAEILMGKNTFIKKVIDHMLPDKPELEVLLPLLKNNVCLFMTNGDIKEICDYLSTFKGPQLARSGSTAPVAVTIPAQLTEFGPDKTKFLQTFTRPPIPTKITRGMIEIITDVNLMEAGDTVSPSAAILLKSLNIKPFIYGLDILCIYQAGVVFDPELLDITEDDVRTGFMSGVSNVAAVSLAIGYPTVASVPHSIANGFRNVMAVTAVTDIQFAQVAYMKAFLADPSAFAITIPIAHEIEKEVEEEPPPIEESSSEDEECMFTDIFG